jgi:MFS family permease
MSAPPSIPPSRLEAELASSKSAPSRASVTFGSLSSLNFRWLMGGTLGSSFAMWMEQIGQGWLVEQLTDSPFQLGLVQFVRGFSIIFISPFAGAFADRVDRRKLAGAAAAIQACNALAIGLLVATGHIAIWQLYITAFVGGLSSSVSNPVRQYLVFDAVGEHQLPNAIALNSMVNNMARVVGPGIAGFIVGISISSVFFAEFVFFMVGVLSLVQMRFTQAPPREREPVLLGIRLGAKYLYEHKTLMRLTVLQAIPSALVFPYLQMVPNIAKNYLHVGPSGYGWLQTGVGIGSLVSAFVVASLAEVRHKGTIASVALLTYMTMILAFSFSRIYVLSLFCLILGGLGLVVFSTFNQTLLQLNIENEYRGRVLSLYTMVQGLNPFGSLLLGYIAQQWLGAPHAIALFCCVALVLAFAGGVASKDVRSL